MLVVFDVRLGNPPPCLNGNRRLHPKLPGFQDINKGRVQRSAFNSEHPCRRLKRFCRRPILGLNVHWTVCVFGLCFETMFLLLGGSDCSGGCLFDCFFDLCVVCVC